METVKRAVERPCSESMPIAAAPVNIEHFASDDVALGFALIRPKKRRRERDAVFR